MKNRKAIKIDDDIWRELKSEAVLQDLDLGEFVTELFGVYVDSKEDYLDLMHCKKRLNKKLRTTAIMYENK